MAAITLVVGGARSGKSAYAQRLAESLPAPRVYLATCVPTDDEMSARVHRHRALRDSAIWRTVEEPISVPAVLESLDAEVVLIDCLMLWVTNLMLRAREAARNFDEGSMTERAGDLADRASAREGHVIFVTGEVGLGIVPGNPSARKFRDLLGVCNQTLAARAHTVTSISCGLPNHLKKETSCDS